MYALSRSMLTAAVRVAPCVTARAAMPVRALSIHEYHSHDLMKKFGITTPRGGVATSPEEVVSLMKELGVTEAVVKAQVLAGGRGKGHFENGFQGGVHLVGSPAEAKDIAEKMLGQKLITKQTGAAGRPCSKVMVVEKLSLVAEYYFAILMDRACGGPAMIASTQGGMDIEAVAAENPDAILSEAIPLETGLTSEHALAFATKLGFKSKELEVKAAQEMERLYQLFIKHDSTMVEINPFAVEKDGRVLCMDAKFGFDDNAAYRQKDVFALRDESQENPLDIEAAKLDLNFISLDGTIGCLVNGAGLAMATMDIIQLHGGSPANFLDVGGSATTEQVEGAFKLICSDPNVSCIFVNIFGGIMQCDIIADGIIKASEKMNLQIPVVVRLQGTRVDEAKALIKTSGLNILSEDNLDIAADKAVKVAEIIRLAREANVHVACKNL